MLNFYEMIRNGIGSETAGRREKVLELPKMFESMPCKGGRFFDCFKTLKWYFFRSLYIWFNVFFITFLYSFTVFFYYFFICSLTPVIHVSRFVHVGFDKSRHFQSRDTRRSVIKVAILPILLRTKFESKNLILVKKWTFILQIFFTNDFFFPKIRL